MVLVRQFLAPSLSLIALQISTLVVAGLGAVLLYRLLAWQHNRRLGVLAGAAVVLVSPVGFWATIPKRHVLVATLCLAVLYLFARSRTPSERTFPGIGQVPLHRTLMYTCIALITWVHAAEGLFVFLAVVAFDLPTAPPNAGVPWCGVCLCNGAVLPDKCLDFGKHR
jgi:4-amino-4-deoxy-L-arabinose transferase-like glycosyltransferase